MIEIERNRKEKKKEIQLHPHETPSITKLSDNLPVKEDKKIEKMSFQVKR